ncbi:DUF6531 domain-containing protein [Streptomyces sp. NPDC047525]|uniref:DUF6531 domain-containing protein n=1 Tax=Streptomyces sp. NPDC047525 TaxID=3155264 RepID=UPI003404810E
MGGNRPADWHVLDLDKDPTPGDPDRVRNLAKNLHDFADDVSKVLRDIKGMAGEDAILTWAGKTAESFTAEFEDAPGKLKKLKKSYEMAGDALSTYWPELERAQALADKALVKGREAQGDLSSAQTRLTSADSWMDKAGKEADKYKDDKDSGKDVPKPDPDKVKAATRNANSAEKAQTAAKSDVSAAKSNLDAAKKMAEDARKMREDAAGTAKKKLEDASDAGIQNRKWWEEVGDWVTDNWDTIVAVCKVVVAVLGIIAMIIGGPILGAIVLIAALIVLADTLNKYANGEAGLLDVAFAALDCIPGMKGLTSLRGLAKGAMGLKAGLKGMGKGLRGLKSARSAITDGAKGTYNRLKSKIKGCGDPVDVATGQMFLVETDVTLPGTLPFSFARRAASGYRTGGWFGPSWASTIDQRLEIDDAGVVFVTEDGMLLAYAHPEDPETPVLPEAGPRWPLESLADGGYRIRNPFTGHSHQFAPPSDGLSLLERIADRNGNSISFDHDDSGAPVAIRHSGGYHLRLTVSEGRVSALALKASNADGSDTVIKRYGYTDGNLTSISNSVGTPMRFAYDQHRRITSWTDTNQTSYAYTYDENDRCLTQRGEAGHLSGSFTYDIASPQWQGCRVTEYTTATGAVTRFVINSNCQVIAEVDPMGSLTRTDYDPNHHVVSRTDALGHTTTFRNSALGQPIEMVRPDGSRISYTYDDLNLLSSIHLEDGTTWQQEFDERGNRTTVVDRSGATTEFGYSEAGHNTSITNALGHRTSVRCDPAGLPLEVTDPLGATSRWERDAFGRPLSFTDPEGNTTRLIWTVEGQLARRTNPDGAIETWEYDGEGNCTSHTDPMGNVTRSEYTHFDLLAARVEPNGARYDFTHDLDLRLTRVTSPLGLAWDYTYDTAGRLISETDFDGRTQTYDHDAAGGLISRSNALGQTVRYEYNNLGQMSRKDADGRVTDFTYDQVGQLAQATNPDASLLLSRDHSGLLRSETVNGQTLTHTHDHLGRRTGRITPTGASSTWTYNEAGRRTQLTTSGHIVDFSYSSTGHELSRQIDASATLDYTFDPLGRLVSQSLTTNGDRPAQHRTFTYRADGHLVGIEDQIAGSRSFDLEDTGRVTAVHASNWSESYAYDAAGNQTNATWPESHPGNEATGPRAYSGTRITRAGSVRYEHDDLGRIILRQKARLSRKPDTWRYSWDVEDRLISTITPDGTLWRYTYDPLGRRTAKLRMADDGETVRERTDFTWDGNTLCEQTTTSDELPNPVTLTWDHKGLHPIAQTERLTAADAPQHEIDSRFFAIVTDLVGTPTELLDEQGEVAWRARTTLWGTTTWPTASTAYTPLRFPGQYHDPETGLHYNHFRHYDPETARYLTPDPLGLAPAPNSGAYVHNPHTWIDPLGLSPTCPDDEPFKLYRAPGKGNRAREAEGLDPALHPDTPEGGAGTAYLGETDRVAQKYAEQGMHEDGYHIFTMKPGFKEAFPESVKPAYRRTHDNKPDEFQWVIPKEDIPKFNSYIQDVQWMNYRQGYAWPD